MKPDVFDVKATIHTILINASDVANTGGSEGKVFELLHEHPADLIVALGREGKSELGIDANQRPRCAAMAKKFKSPPNGWVKNILGFRQFSMRGLIKVKGRMETRLRCPKPAKDSKIDVDLGAAKTALCVQQRDWLPCLIISPALRTKS